VAEILLRKTTARQVEKLYSKFLEKYPAPRALANTSTKELQTLLRPLGMEYKRARLFKKLGAKIVENHDGKVPDRLNELLELPGVGRYAANAVLCFAYGKDEPLVDTNVVRVVVRVFGFKSQKARLKDDPSLWAFAKSLLPSGGSRNFNLALLDFAAQVCTAKNPKCDKCIERDICQY
jgi:A/G-specific adenine glycosylase